ncbi:TylF/MycF/NovP-related O-methyltransferase [Stenomitos frigidus]|uniref:TylF/MycF/NovP-related O-methyltransferase n=1 Tax=Stenomitos frigidus TaxID=1886765 RepID=UPI0015E69CB6|nr:TylF/MycF/NovP-related O-methyltransferase [Stenomitos frigidus]
MRNVLQADRAPTIAEPAVNLPAVEEPALEAPTAESAEETVMQTVLQKVRPYSMVPDSGIEFLIRSVQSLFDQQIEGDFVECGVWKGGCAAAIKLAELALQPDSQRLLHLFDSYEGLPPVQPIDGPMAAGWQQAVDSPWYFDNCAASLEVVQQNFAQLGLLDARVQFYKGWFETTVPEFVKRYPETKIAILRLDGDWYESTKVCLENLYPLVSEKGIIIIDDYYAWDGCAVAVHEYLGKHGLNHRIRSIPDFSSAYIIKQAHREA